MYEYMRTSLAVAAGIASHYFFFLHGEYHMQAPRILSASFLAFTTLVSLLTWENGNTWQAAKASTFIAMAYFLSLTFSMTLYRLFFHQLCKFPGPVSARISKLWHVFRLIRKPNFLLLDELHHHYGDVVRMGPNELSIRSPEAMIAVHGPGSRCNKAPFYDLLLPRLSIITTRERALHDKRRRIWDQAFSMKSLAGYEEAITRYCHQLDEEVAASVGQSIDVSALFHYFSFDVMTELSFGKSFSMLKSEKNRFIIHMLANGMQLLGLVSPTPWLARIGFFIPGLANGWKAMFHWSDQQMQERLDRKNAKADITSWLIDAMKQEGATKSSRDWLNGDGFGIIIAGSDTTASTLLLLFYHLACDPTQVEKIRAEVDGLSELTAASLLSLPHLNGVINETLRLHPPVPSAGLRETPSEGLTISGHFIPGNTVVAVPVYSLHRLESCFDRPLDFIPERWYSSPGKVKDKAAFAPFFRGRYGCVGRNLALMEIRLVTALLAQRYDIAFPPGSDRGAALLENTKDHFTAVPGELILEFKRRN